MILYYKEEKGFTLIEILIAMALSSILVLTVGGAFLASNRVFNYNNEKINIQQEHRVIVNRIAPYIRMSTAPPIIVNGAYGSSQDRVRFVFTTINADVDYNGIGFGIDGNRRLYYRRRNANTGNWGNRVAFIDSQVNRFEVDTDINNEMVTITVELSEDYQRADGNIATYTFVDTFYRRIP